MTIRFMTEEDMDAILGLQDKIYEHLHSIGKPRFIVPRTMDYIQEHLDAPHTIMGFVEDGAQVAQAIFHAPAKFDMNELGVKTLPDHTSGERVSVLQGVLVDPDYRGRGLMAQIIASWMTWSYGQDILHLSARAEASHEASKYIFSKQGFALVDTMIDPRDGASICVFHRKLG